MYRLILAAFLTQGILDSKADGVSSGRLISEAIPAWQRRKAAEERVRFTLETRRWATEDGKLRDSWSRHSRSHVVHDGPSFLVTARSLQGTGEACIGANPRYLFKVDRPSETAEYILRSLDRDSSEEARSDLERQMTSLLSICRSRLLASIPLDEVVTDPGFKLGTIEEVLEEGRKCLKVHFSGALVNHKQTFLDSWMILDPSREWSILSSESNFAKFKLTVHNEYRPATGGISWLRSSRMTNVYPEEHVEENTEYTFGEVDQAPIPAATFLLSSFGMPEPDQPVVADHQSKLHFWFVGGALVMFSVAYMLRRRSLRPALTM